MCHLTNCILSEDEASGTAEQARGVQLPDQARREGCRAGGGRVSVPLCWRSPLLVSAFYVVVCRLLELVVLLGRRDRAKELEIPVLRHELSIQRRQLRRPRFETHDRVLLAAFSRMRPRHSWTAFSVRPETSWPGIAGLSLAAGHAATAFWTAAHRL